MAPFDHPAFRTYSIEDVPLDCDLYLMDVVWLPEWERQYVRLAEDEEGDPYAVGYISYASANRVGLGGIELSWFPNVHDRFHRVDVTLPRDAFVAAVEAWNYDKRPTIFVKSEWLRELHLRSNSIFALIDAANMAEAMRAGRLTRGKLILLRDRVDALAAAHPSFSFVSFADSILIKTNWQAGMVGTGVTYGYSPEPLFDLFGKLQIAYRELIDLEIYGVFAQGVNEFYDDALTHVSASGNHLSLNSLGLPFAQLQRIDEAARKAIRAGVHGPHQLYMDEDFFLSLNFKDYRARSAIPSAPYDPKLSSRPGRYFYSDCAVILKNI